MKYLITMLCGFGLAAWVAFNQNIMEKTSMQDIFHVLTDAFFIPAILILGVGALIFVTNEGAFDAISFGLKSFWSMFNKKLKHSKETYYDFRAARSEKRLPFGFLLICGLFFFAVSMVMLYLYYRFS